MSGTGKTPGQRAYEAYHAAVADVLLPPWGELTSAEHRAWEAAATAGAAPAHERAAELAGEGNELRRQLMDAHSETRHFLARIDALARELEAFAAMTAPSKKSEIEAATAKRLRAITCTNPAIAGAGTEHVARQLLDPGNPDAWQRVADMPARDR